MNERMLPEDAAQALAEVDRRQRQVIALAAVPAWYWWAVGALMVVLAVGVDVRTDTSIGIAVPVFVIGMLAATGRVVLGAFRRALPRNDLLVPQGVFAILGFVGLAVGVTLAVAFTLRAAGVPYPATSGCALGAIVMGTGGPLLSRYLTRVMLRNRSAVGPRARATGGGR
jgi:uncharacterized membrane protein YkvI